MTSPLGGMHVVELAPWRPAPYAGQLLAEQGAHVVKIEPPGGDPMRAYPELYEDLNGRKEILEIDLKDPGGRAAVLERAAESHAVLEGFRPGVADRLGVGYDAVRTRRPDVIWCSVSTLGQDGPLAHVVGHDVNAQAWAGALDRRRGRDPVDPPLPIGDLAAGVAAAFAVSSAYAGWLAHGEGAYLDLAMTDVLVTWAGLPTTNRAAGIDQQPGQLCSYGVFAVADGHVALGIVAEDHFWRALCEGIGLDDLADVAFVDRMKRTPELHPRVAAALAERARDELVADLIKRGVPISPIAAVEDVAINEHFRVRGLVVTDPAGGPRLGPMLRRDSL